MARDRRSRDDYEDEDDRPARKRRPAEDDEDEAPRAKKKPRVVEDDEDDKPRPKKKVRVVEEEEDEEEAPRDKKKPRVVEDDEDEEDERPRRRRRSANDEDDRPRRKAKKKKGMSVGLLVGLIGGGIALVAVALVLIFVIDWGGGPTPRQVYDEYWAHVQNKRFDKVWEMLSAKEQESYNTTALRNGSISGKESYVKIKEDYARLKDPAEIALEVTGFTIDGDRATVSYKMTAPKLGIISGSGTVSLVRESRKWKLQSVGW